MAVSQTVSLTVPPTQNTAPVLEFGCLYTHDLRRKAKRWQDGVLRFHTFNKRVMVYDITRNFIGDVHWQENEGLQAGDEVTLQNGILVQVLEAIGQTETDLTALLQSRTKRSPPKVLIEAEPRQGGSCSVTGVGNLQPRLSNASPRRSSEDSNRATGRHKQYLDSPRAGEAENWEISPAAKRQRTSINAQSQTWRIVRTSHHVNSGTKPESPLWARTADAVKKRALVNSATSKRGSEVRSQAILPVKEVIVLSSNPQESACKDSAPITESSIVKEGVEARRGLSCKASPCPVPIVLKVSNPTLLAQSGRNSHSPVRSAKYGGKGGSSIGERGLAEGGAGLHAQCSALLAPKATTRANQGIGGDPEGEKRLDRALGDRNETEMSATSPVSLPRKILRPAPRAPRKTLICQNLPTAAPKPASSKPRPAASPACSRPPPQPTATEEDAQDYLCQFRKAQEERIRSRMSGKATKKSLLDELDAPSQPLGDANPSAMEVDADYGAANVRSTIVEPADTGKKPSVAVVAPTDAGGVAGNSPIPLEIVSMEKQLLDTKLAHRVKAVRSTSRSKEDHPRKNPDFDRVKPAVTANPTTPAINTTNPHQPHVHATAARPFRRVQSENDIAIPNAAKEPGAAVPAHVKPPTKRVLQRSLTVAVPGRDTAPKPRRPATREPMQEEPKDTDLGPWSREALDLFDWRPPDRDENLVLIERRSAVAAS